MAEPGQAMTRVETQRPPAPGGGNLPPQLGRWIGERAFRQLALIAGLALAVAAGIWLFMWAREPVYRTLYSQLAEQDAAQVMDALQAAAIDYRIDPNTGAILVPAERVHDARLQLASQGLPQSGGVGFELLQQDQGFGTSQFMENARFHRALETELARSISSLQSVNSARVHLAIPKQSVFVREDTKPSASVVVKLFPGRSLTDGQVASIVHMVASSVPGLPDARVTVVDQGGQLLTNRDDGLLGASTQQLAYKQQIESGYVNDIETLLTPMLGAGRVRAQVNAKLDFAVQESTQEIYDPNGAVVRSEQTSEQRQGAGNLAQGVPGALTNQPPGAGSIAGETNASGEAPAAAGSDLNRSATRNYEIGRTVRHTRRPLGEITRLSVAVLVDQKTVRDSDGKPVQEPLSQAEIDQVTKLVREAVGFDEQRGDSISVISAAFQEQEAVPELPEPSLLEQPWVRDSAKWLAAALVLLAILFIVVRPIIKALVAGAPVRVQERPRPEPSEEEALKQLSGPGANQMAAPGRERALPGSSNAPSYEESLASARSVVSQEPALAANVVKGWLAEDE